MSEPFRPSRHGFRFPNRFALPMSGALAWAGLPGAYGLCGGMAAAAAEAYLAGEPLPGAPEPPAPGSRLHRRLVRRQLATLDAPGFGGARRYVAWMRLPPEERARRTDAELAAARAALGQGRLVLLGLLFTDRLLRVWENHQVLAYARTEGPHAAERLRVYDPNRPGRDDVVLARLAPPRAPLVLRAGGTAARPVLGAFITQTLPPAEGAYGGFGARAQ